MSKSSQAAIVHGCVVATATSGGAISFLIRYRKYRYQLATFHSIDQTYLAPKQHMEASPLVRTDTLGAPA